MLSSCLSRSLTPTGALLYKAGRLAKPVVINPAQRKMCGFVKDWEPGPPPRTPAEYAAAAKKYNMIPEDYEPGDPNQWAMGDYPELPYVSEEGKDPYDDYCTYGRRWNYGETMHWEAEFLENDTGINIQLFENTKFHTWDTYCLSMGFFATIMSILILGWWGDARIDRPMKPKQWPGESGYMGLKHYTFEPLYD